jgi:RND family efflux transporter MFP subunit
MKAITKGLIFIIAVAVVVVAVFRISRRDPQTNTGVRMPTLVKVEMPKRQTIIRNLALTGDILPIRQAQVFARVYGNLQSVDANIGDYVSADQILARIDTTELLQRYLQAEAGYQNTLGVYNRAKLLMDQNLISKQDFDDAETNMEIAKENFENARTQLDYAKIMAPFPGFITRRYLDPGVLVTSTNAILFTLADLDTIKVIVNVLEKDVPSVTDGMRAVVTVDALPGREFTGAVTRMGETLDLDTRTMPVEIDISNKDHLLKPGMFAVVSIIISSEDNALTLPTQALLKDAKGYYVFSADKGVARRLDVTLGSEQDSRTEILSGVSETDSVITTGQQFIRDGGPITIQP